MGMKTTIMKHIICALSGIAATILSYIYIFPLVANEAQTSLNHLAFSMLVGVGVGLAPYADWRRIVKG